MHEFYVQMLTRGSVYPGLARTRQVQQCQDTVVVSQCQDTVVVNQRQATVGSREECRRSCANTMHAHLRKITTSGCIS